jgi:hypothetical protein
VIIVEVAVHDLLLGMRGALTIWFAMVALAAVACALMCAPGWRSPHRAARERRRAAAKPSRVGPPASGGPVRPDTTRRLRPPAPAEQAAELHRYAGEVAVAASRAAEAADRWHAEWVAVQRAQDAAWRTYEVADSAARRATKASVFPVSDQPLTPDELRARVRYLHRAATEAYRRGELSVQQLTDALAHRNGWDPLRHPFDQDLRLRRIGRDRKLQAYQAVAALEQSAWHSAEMAAAAKSSLRDEAFSAALSFRRAQERTAVSGQRGPASPVSGRAARQTTRLA